MADADVGFRYSDVLDQELFDSLRTAHRFAKPFRGLVHAVRVLIKEDIPQARRNMAGDLYSANGTADIGPGDADAGALQRLGDPLRRPLCRIEHSIREGAGDDQVSGH